MSFDVRANLLVSAVTITIALTLAIGVAIEGSVARQGPAQLQIGYRPLMLMPSKLGLLL